MISQMRDRSQITIPVEIMKQLNLKTGDNIDISLEDGAIVIKPVVIVPKDQAWFWSKEWQKEEKEADEDIKTGRVRSADSLEDLMGKLKDEN